MVTLNDVQFVRNFDKTKINSKNQLALANILIRQFPSLCTSVIRVAEIFAKRRSPSGKVWEIDQKC